MDKEFSLKKRIIQFRERVLGQDHINDDIITQYNLLEKQFKKNFPEVSFEDKNPINYPSIWKNLMGPDKLEYSRKRTEILFRLEHMISSLPDESNTQVINYHFTSIENLHQLVNSLYIDNSIKQTINQSITELEKEIKKPKKNKEKIKDIIKNLLAYELPKEILMELIKILLKIINGP